MSCEVISNIQPINFVISVEIPCGFVLNAAATALPKALFIDTHCVALINQQLKEEVEIPNTNGLVCEICVNKTVLVGALHYDMVVGGFVRAINGNPNTPDATLAQITKSQSICIHSIPVALNCEDCLTNPCELKLEDFTFTPTFVDMILYSNNHPQGILNSTDPAAFIAALQDVTPPGGEDNANGCKTLVFVGHIDIA